MKDTNLLNYEDFRDELIKKLQMHYGDKETIVTGGVFKPNVGELTGVSFRKPDMQPSATLYIENLYKAYCNCGSLDEAVKRAITVFSADPPEFMGLAGFDLTDTKGLLEKTYCHVVGAQANRAMLEGMPHKRHEDLAVVCRVLVDKDGDGVSSMKITNDILDSMGVSLEELHERALENTQRFFPQRLIGEGKELMPEACFMGKLPFIVLTNEAKTYGAAAAFYPGVLEELAESMGHDLFLLPSSMHEFIILPDTGDYSEEVLAMMVKDVNDTSVSAEDKLTDSVYRYRRGDETFRLCKGQEQESAA